MADPSGWKSRIVTDEDIPTPEAGKIHVYWTATGQRFKRSDGLAYDPPSLSSFNGRTGAIVPQQSDYDAFFLTAAEGNAAYEAIGAGASAASSAIAAHVAAGDPHPAYLTLAEGAAAFDALGAASSAVAAHAGAADPHPVYMTTTEGNAAYPPLSRVFATTAPLAGGGDFSTNRTLTISAATTAVAGSMAPEDRRTLLGLRKILYFVEDYGTLTDGSDTATVAGGIATANRQAFDAALNAAKAAGGGWVIAPPGTFHIDQALTAIDVSCVRFYGAGGYGTSQVGNQSGPGTCLFWNATGSPATTAMLTVSAVQGASNPAVKGVVVEGFTLQCAGNVGIGLRVKSAHFCTFRNLYVINPTSKGIVAECFVTTTELGEAGDNTKDLFETISIRCTDGAGASAVGISLEGSSNANTSNSMFQNVAVQHVNGVGLDCRNSDSNRFYNVVINTNNGGTGRAVALRGAASSGAECRGNTFFGLSPGGSSSGTRGLVSEGTETAGVTFPARDNRVFDYSTENGEPLPVIGTGSSLHFVTSGGSTGGAFTTMLGNIPSVALNANFTTSAVTATSSALAFPIGPNESWRVEAVVVAQKDVGTTGLKFAIGAPVGATVDGWLEGTGAAPGTRVQQRLNSINTLLAGTFHTAAAATALGPNYFEFTITNGATPGTVAIQAATVTSGQITFFAVGSGLRAQRVTRV